MPPFPFCGRRAKPFTGSSPDSSAARATRTCRPRAARPFPARRCATGLLASGPHDRAHTQHRRQSSGARARRRFRRVRRRLALQSEKVRSKPSPATKICPTASWANADSSTPPCRVLIAGSDTDGPACPARADPIRRRAPASESPSPRPRRGAQTRARAPAGSRRRRQRSTRPWRWRHPGPAPRPTATTATAPAAARAPARRRRRAARA